MVKLTKFEAVCRYISLSLSVGKWPFPCSVVTLDTLHVTWPNMEELVMFMANATRDRGHALPELPIDADRELCFCSVNTFTRSIVLDSHF